MSARESGFRGWMAGMALVVVLLAGTAVRVEARPPASGGRVVAANDEGGCVDCHRQKSPGIVKQWEKSGHGKSGISCLDCHKSSAGAPGAFQHGAQTIHTIVTPKDCKTCHDDEVTQFMQSHHARAASFIGSLDNILGEVVEGRMAAAQGCQQCHGSTVTLLKDEKGAVKSDRSGRPEIDPATWPNTGIGRVNLDGSLGSCTACHSRHDFSRNMARQPETCGKCHMGPDHPQMEIYTESKHGIAYRTRHAEMNLASPEWVVGRDYSAAPTCATCHMSATTDQKVTHDVGDRISWTLRPVISKKLDHWEARRQKMQGVCQACHGEGFVRNFYHQYDAGVALYNGKFAEPAQKIMDLLRQAKKLTPTPFDEKIEWSFYHLWHHEGRRARMGLSMMGPDYTQWHGFFEVAERFYFELLPEARERAAHDSTLLKAIAGLLDTVEHRWLKGLSREDVQKVRDFYRTKYGQ